MERETDRPTRLIRPKDVTVLARDSRGSFTPTLPLQLHLREARLNSRSNFPLCVYLDHKPGVGNRQVPRARGVGSRQQKL